MKTLASVILDFSLMANRTVFVRCAAVFTGLVFLCVAGLAISAGILSYETAAPDAELVIRKSITGPVTASILGTVVPDADPNLFEPGEIYLKIEDANGSWWVHTPAPYDSMDVIQFIDATRLLVRLMVPAGAGTAVLNLEDRSLFFIGGGTGELLPSSSEDPLIHLAGGKGYSDGAYWYASITDLHGRIIEFQSIEGSDSCVKISEILLSTRADISRLKQPLDYCVGVAR